MAFSRRARGLIKRELGAIRAVIQPPGRSGHARTGFTVGLPSAQELVDIIRQSDTEMGLLLAGFMKNTSSAAYRQAQEAVATQLVEIEGVLGTTLMDRALAVSHRFAEARAMTVRALLEKAVSQGMTIRELDQAIADRFASLATHYVDGIGRTEMAFAFEQTAYAAWYQAGVQYLEYVFGGGPCRTGVCEEAATSSPIPMGSDLGSIGASFEPTASPPLHPNCTCFMVPFIDETGTVFEGPSRTEVPVASTLEGASQVMSEAYPHIDVDWTDAGRGVEQVSVEAANQINAQLAALMDEYPEVAATIEFIGSKEGQFERILAKAYEPMKQAGLLPSGATREDLYRALASSKVGMDDRTYAHCLAPAAGAFEVETWGQYLVFNPKYFSDLQKFMRSISDDVMTGYHPTSAIGQEVKSVVTHEFGHAVANTIARYGLMDEFRIEVSQVLGISTNQIRRRSPEFHKLAKEVSGYAATNFNEFIAEVWADYKLNPKASKLVKDIGGLMEKMLAKGVQKARRGDNLER